MVQPNPLAITAFANSFFASKMVAAPFSAHCVLTPNSQGTKRFTLAATAAASKCGMVDLMISTLTLVEMSTVSAPWKIRVSSATLS
jgi:hypothetical protein